MQFLTNVWKSCVSGVRKALPLMILIVGSLIYLSSLLIDPLQQPILREFLNGFGKMAIGSAIFSFLVKAYQFSGVFKEELEKTLFEPKYIANRKDLPTYWDKLSIELFKDKFPHIKQKLLKDIREKYMPVSHMMYYDDSEHVIDIKLLDETTGDVEVNQIYTINAIPVSDKGKHIYEFNNALPFENEEGNTTFEHTITINGNPCEVKHTRNVKDNVIYNNFKVLLAGKDKYQIKRTSKARYNIYYDNILYFLASKMYNKLKVEVHFPKDKLRIELKKCGTLEDFNFNGAPGNSARFFCNGIIYPEQGYYINVKPLKQVHMATATTTTADNYGGKGSPGSA